MQCRNAKRKVGYWVKERVYPEHDAPFRYVDKFIIDTMSLHYCECPACKARSNVLPKEISPHDPGATQRPG